MFLPLGENTVENVEVWKKGACFESMKPQHESDSAELANGL